MREKNFSLSENNTVCVMLLINDSLENAILKNRYYSLEKCKKVSKKDARTRLVLVIQILHFKLFQMCSHHQFSQFLTCSISKYNSDKRSFCNNFVQVFVFFTVIKFILISCFISRKYKTKEHIYKYSI